MPMPTFSDLKSLEAFLKKSVDNALNAEVAQAIKETQSDVIQDVVYNAYTPKLYQRRGALGGGLGDTTNMYHEVYDGVLTVENRTPPNPDYSHTALQSKSIDTAVERGERYDYWGDAFPRPFTAKTVERLENSDILTKAISSGLNRQGITAN